MYKHNFKTVMGMSLEEPCLVLAFWQDNKFGCNNCDYKCHIVESYCVFLCSGCAHMHVEHVQEQSEIFYLELLRHNFSISQKLATQVQNIFSVLKWTF